MLSWLRNLFTPSLKVRCPKSGHLLRPTWIADHSSLVLGGVRTERRVLFARCPCGWAGRANNPRVLILA